MKLYSLASFALILAGASAFAAPCFHQGSYKGMGFGTDEGGNQYSYMVNTTIASASQATSDYTWPSSGKASFAIQVQGNAVYVNGSAAPSGTASCEMAASHISLKGINSGQTI